MKFTTIATTILPLVTFTAASPPGWGGSGWGGGWGGSSQKAVYFLRVDPLGSTVVAIGVGSDGKLTSSTSSTSTGGVGLQSQNATDDYQPTAIDPLQGQQAVSVGDDYLFTINSGSDTAVIFKINPQNPLELTMLGEPVPTLGEFAMSIAYSSKYQKACVLNGGVINGVTCYKVSDSGLEPDGVGLREFGYNATTPAQLGGPLGSGSDIQFSPDSSKVITTFKGDTTPATLGHVSIFDVDESGDVAATCTDNQVKPLAGPFGFALSNDPEKFYITAVNFGGVLVSLDLDTNIITIDSIVNLTSDSFVASCWSVWAPSINEYVDIPAGNPAMAKISAAGENVGIINYDSKLAGATDTVVMGTNIIFLTAINAVGVLDLTTGELVQEYMYSTAADRPFWTGMASYPASPLLSGNQ